MGSRTSVREGRQWAGEIRDTLGPVCVCCVLPVLEQKSAAAHPRKSAAESVALLVFSCSVPCFQTVPAFPTGTVRPTQARVVQPSRLSGRKNRVYDAPIANMRGQWRIMKRPNVTGSTAKLHRLMASEAAGRLSPRLAECRNGGVCRPVRVYLLRLLRTFRAMAEAKMKASSSLLSVSRMSSLVPSHHLRPW